MLKYLVFTLIALVMVTVRASPIQPKTTFEIIQLEDACVLQGGWCVHPDECEPGNLAHLPGLCPLQQHRGIQCCYRP
ncbi:unnamed protein product [Arctia plantaginis]|uniref:Uncharacterized protein n=1 Tax=Arctia plantaginis TaxID=874455 RepID=A0A8S0YQC1_ARCPL|nr:unnamed protein product [Arctia plantaginis]